ncbi:MAG: hypothetical protein ACR2IP_02380 [Solirubrobacteraceae bacterium]
MPEPESRPGHWRHLAARTLDWIEPDQNPAGVVYGTLIVGAVLASESVRRETFPDTLGATALALALYWMAHSYAQTLGRRLDDQIPLSAAGLVRSLVHDRAIVRGASMPILALLIAWAVGATLATGVLAAIWTSAVSIVAFELVAGIRAQMRRAELLLQVCAGAVMGLSVIALRALLH